MQVLIFLAPTLDSADPLFALVTTPGFYLNRVKVADQDPASNSLYIQTNNVANRDLLL